MTQNRSVPTATMRSGDDFEWVNNWAAASGLDAARVFAAAPAKAAASPASIAPVPAAIPPASTTAVPARVFPIAADQLVRDIAEIEKARDAIIAAEGKGVFVQPAPKPRKAATPGLLRRQDAVPVLTGAMLAMFVLVVYGAIASIMALGR